MLGVLTYIWIIAFLVYGIAWLVDPILAVIVVAALTAGSYYRYHNNRGNEREEKGFWFVAMPAYIFSLFMLWYLFR